MINSNIGNPVQAVPLIEGKINVGAGTYTCNSVIHCEADCELSFPNFGTATSYNMVAGEDRAFNGVVEVVSGTITYD